MGVLNAILADARVGASVSTAKQLSGCDFGEKSLAPYPMMLLNDGAGAHIRHEAYKYRKLIDFELAVICRIKDMQQHGLALIGSGIVATMVGIANFVSKLAFAIAFEGAELDTVKIAIFSGLGGIALIPLLILM